MEGFNNMTFMSVHLKRNPDIYLEDRVQFAMIN
jgi:hypothetical protein